MAAVSGSGAAKVTLPTDEQILITREFDAPRELVGEYREIVPNRRVVATEVCEGTPADHVAPSPR